MEWGQTRMWSRNTQRDGSTAALLSVLQVHMWRTCAADIRDTQQRLIWDLLRCFCCSVKRNMTLLRTDISSSLTTEDADYRWLSKWPHGHTDSLHVATTLTSDQCVTQYLHLLSCRFTTLEVYSCHTRRTIMEIFTLRRNNLHQHLLQLHSEVSVSIKQVGLKQRKETEPSQRRFCTCLCCAVWYFNDERETMDEAVCPRTSETLKTPHQFCSQIIS